MHFFICNCGFFHFKDYGTNQTSVIMKIQRVETDREINSGSMADIAFLLLIFFLMTTTIAVDKGLAIMLPPKTDQKPVAPIAGRNLFKVYINSSDRLMAEGEVLANAGELKPMIQTFVLNRGASAELSDNPEKAVVSLKTDRGTSYKAYISALDEIQGAYYEIYGERIGLTAAGYRQLDLKDPEQRALHEKARAGIPMNISIAEPTR